MSRCHIDDSTYSVWQMLQNMVLQFNNERLVLTLPPDVDDLADTEEIDANDNSRIRITRNCKYNILFICFILFLRLLTIINFKRSSTGIWAKHVYDTTRILYKYVLTLWFKGTGNGSGQPRCLKVGWMRSSTNMTLLLMTMITVVLRSNP